MDFGGFQLGLVEIVGVLLLAGALLWAVMRVKSGGKKDSPAITERATHEVYVEEDRRLHQETDGR